MHTGARPPQCLRPCCGQLMWWWARVPALLEGRVISRRLAPRSRHIHLSTLHAHHWFPPLVPTSHFFKRFTTADRLPIVQLSTFAKSSVALRRSKHEKQQSATFRLNENCKSTQSDILFCCGNQPFFPPTHSLKKENSSWPSDP